LCSFKAYKKYFNVKIKPTQVTRMLYDAVEKPFRLGLVKTDTCRLQVSYNVYTGTYTVDPFM